MGGRGPVRWACSRPLVPLRFFVIVGALLSGRYRVEQRVGTGGMGEVYRATDTSTQAVVAIKVLQAKARKIDRKRFLREIQILKDLRHPGVVHYVDHGVTSDRRLFLVMEWLDGEDLAVRLARSQVGLKDAVEIVRRASQALAAVHARGIVHRDLHVRSQTHRPLTDSDPVRPEALDQPAVVYVVGCVDSGHDYYPVQIGGDPVQEGRAVLDAHV